MQAASLNRIKQYAQRGFYASLLLSALVFGAVGSAQASLLGLTLNDSPDIMVGSIVTIYNQGTNAFTASGFPSQLFNGINTLSITDPRTFDINAFIDESGNLSSGTLTITGQIASLGLNGSLLTGNLTAFGWATVNDPFEFLFDVTGGGLASLWGGNGGIGGIILSGHGFDSWTKDWTSSSAVADVGVVPVPAAIWLFGSALLGLAGYGRHTRRKQASV